MKKFKIALVFVLLSSSASAQSFASDNRVIRGLFADESTYTEVTYNSVKIFTENEQVRTEIADRWHVVFKKRKNGWVAIVKKETFVQIQKYFND